MKPALRRLLLCVLLPVVGFGAQAQGDEVLERYGLALVNLSESMRLMESDGTASRDELDRAAGALRFLASSAGGPNLVEAMERVFERARTAIQNRSTTDLAVQSSLLRGGFQRALFDSALAVLPSERAAAMARFERLADDLEFGEETRAAITSGRDGASIRRAFEIGVAGRVQDRLRQSAQRAGTDQDEAYRLLADAYGDSLLIQDSPRADPRLNPGFASAAEALVDGRTEEMIVAVESLVEGLGRLAAAAQAVPAPAPEVADTAEATPVQPTPVQPAEQPAAVAGEAAPETAPADAAGQPSPDEAAPGAAPAGQQQEAAPAADAAPARAADTVATPDLPLTDAATPAETEAGTEAVERPAAPADTRALTVELIAAGVPARQAATIAADLATRGIGKLGDAVDNLYAPAGRLLAALQTSDSEAADAALDRFVAVYAAELAPVVSVTSPEAHQRALSLTSALDRAPALRSQDAIVLLGAVEALEQVLDGGPDSPVQAANTQTTLVWAGWVRLAVLIVLALLSAIPLYLLNLAFGGGNRNWQLVGIALFLLLLPAVYEGLASLGVLIAKLAGIDVLAAGVTFSMFQSPIGQVAWAAITVAAIVFATMGLYGICVQFGLLGPQKGTVGDSQTVLRSTAVAPDSDTVVDWDEEF
jgi:hypothetical protein